MEAPESGKGSGSCKRKAPGDDAGTPGSEAKAASTVELKAPAASAESLAERVARPASGLVAGVCPDFLASNSRWARLTSWAQRLCSLGEPAKDELLYWETYQAQPGEAAREQLLRQVRADLDDMAARLEECGCSREEASVANEADSVEALCELLAHLLTLLQQGTAAAATEASSEAPLERRYFAVSLELNQEGCCKFHDDSRYTTLRVALPLLGPGPVLALHEHVEWAFWERQAGLLDKVAEAGPEEGLRIVKSWNEQVCIPAKETHVAEGSLVIFRGGALEERPLLHRAMYGPEGEAPVQMVITLDHVTQEVKDQLIEMNLDPEDEGEESEEEGAEE